jgi:hypothetical protein
MPKDVVTVGRDSDLTMTRRILRNAWNGNGAAGVDHGHRRVTTPFRAVMNLGDFLGRVHYNCGGPNAAHADKPGQKRLVGMKWQNCDDSNVQAASCNVKFVADSSLYTRYRKEAAINQNFNDISYGPPKKNNNNYVNYMAAIHHH